MLLYRIKCLFFSPFYLLFLLNKSNNHYELRKWETTLHTIPYRSDFLCFIRMFASFPEYRTLVLYRAGIIGNILSAFVPHLKSLHFITKSEYIGKGLVLQHGFSSIIFPERMGENCQIWHNVTIGRAHQKGNRPRIGNNVKICTGAIVIGDIEIGDNVVIGAAAVVTKSIPENSVVVGNPARIVRFVK